MKMESNSSPKFRNTKIELNQSRCIMRYLHTMLRVRDLDAALDFYCNKLGLKEVRRIVNDQAKFTLVFLAAGGDDALVANGPENRAAPLVELTYNWITRKIMGRPGISATSPTRSTISTPLASS
jgi:catechol 2,3-dioxygenase-like lactoylglutathione lyase family enzyme